MLPDSMDTLTLSIYWRGEDTSQYTVKPATVLNLPPFVAVNPFK